jgi:hypothetical protein
VVGEGAVVVGAEPVVLEDDGSGLASPPHPASNIDAASGRASSAAEGFFTVPPTFIRGRTRVGRRSKFLGTDR